jgi:hypothetical protein
MKYWHELSDDEQVKIKSSFDNFNIDIRNEYIKPDWCKFSRALQKFSGCWPLLHGLVRGTDAAVCKKCYFRKPLKENDDDTKE